MAANDKFYSFPEVQRIAGNKSRTTLWRWSRAGIFPKPRRIGPNSVGYVASEVDSWLEARAGDKAETA